MSGNIFDLSQLVPKNNEVEVSKHKNISQNNITVDENEYESIDKDDWDKIPSGTFIRYQRTDGNIRVGGNVIKIWKAKDQSGGDTIKIDLGASGKQWSIYAGNVDKIWKKLGGIEINNSMGSMGSIELTELKEDLHTCKESIKLISNKLQEMANEQKRIILLIKKLHNLN